MPETTSTYQRIQSLLREHPWALLPSALDLMVEIVERRIEGREPSAEQKQVAIEAARRQPQMASVPGAIAVLPVFGLLSHRSYLVQDLSGPRGTSAEQLLRDFQALVAATQVSAIVLDVDSPGGSVFGIQELADAIFAARGTKPIVAVANSLAASAAYWIASQADELVVTPSGQVGSIGVLAIHDDVSKAEEMKGVKRTFISSAPLKVEGNSFEPLGDGARAEIQARVDAYHDTFVRNVARGRGVSLSAVRERFGQGRVVAAGDAVSRGMADREATLQETIDRLQQKADRATTRAETGAPVIAATEPETAPDAAKLAAARARLDLARVAAG